MLEEKKVEKQKWLDDFKLTDIIYDNPTFQSFLSNGVEIIGFDAYKLLGDKAQNNIVHTGKLRVGAVRGIGGGLVYLLTSYTIYDGKENFNNQKLILKAPEFNDCFADILAPKYTFSTSHAKTSNSIMVNVEKEHKNGLKEVLFYLNRELVAKDFVKRDRDGRYNHFFAAVDGHRPEKIVIGKSISSIPDNVSLYELYRLCYAEIVAEKISTTHNSHRGDILKNITFYEISDIINASELHKYHNSTPLYKKFNKNENSK